jgi:signal transduction histidine kinase
MKNNQLNIAIVSEDKERSLNFKLFLQEPACETFFFTHNKALTEGLKSAVFDLVIFDCVGCDKLIFKQIGILRSNRNFIRTPFLYILNANQETYRVEIYKDERSAFLQEPFDKFEFLSTYKNLVMIGELERRVFIYDDVLKSEKKLIFYLDEILQLSSFEQINSIDAFFTYLEQQFIQRLALIFAVEMALYLEYMPKQDSLLLRHYSETKRQLTKKSLFTLRNSHAKRALLENQPYIFESSSLDDPFIQELNQAMDFEFETVLFVPFAVLHKSRGCFVLINKVYRHAFTENDLALAIITVQKLVNRLETIFLNKMQLPDFEPLIKEKLAYKAPTFAEKLPRDILQSVNFGIIVFDEKYFVHYLNDFANKTLSIRFTKNLSLIDVVGAEAFRTVDLIIKSNKIPALRQELMIENVSRKPLYLGFSIYALNTPESEKQFIVTFMEISQNKQLQAEIIRMDRMASLGVLASGIAHEIRNPLAGIKAMAQTLEEELGDDKTKIEYIERIVRQVNRLDVLLKSFFSYAKPQRPNPECCNFPDIVREVLPLFNRKIKEQKINVIEIYSPELKSIYVDFNQIQQVIFNLVINAIDAMKKGGTLTINARVPEHTHTLIDRRQAMPKVFSDMYNEITIIDTGDGIDESVLNQIYNPFYTTKSNGTGLGLSIVYQIIREHGGQISVESRIGKGTTFVILLPVYQESITKPSVGNK